MVEEVLNVLKYQSICFVIIIKICIGSWKYSSKLPYSCTNTTTVVNVLSSFTLLEMIGVCMCVYTPTVLPCAVNTGQVNMLCLLMIRSHHGFISTDIFYQLLMVYCTVLLTPKGHLYFVAINQ